MSITDELREWAKTLTHWCWWYDPVKDEYTYTTGIMPPSIDAIRLDSNILAIADRIDAEHESKVAEVASGWDYWESTHVELPKDADDVPWRIGDRDEDGNVVTQLRLSSDGWYAVTDGPSAFHPEQRCHYQAPTVEDVLREFAEKMNENMGMYTGEAIDADEWRHADNKTIAEYAAKLKLAEGEDA